MTFRSSQDQDISWICDNRGMPLTFVDFGLWVGGKFDYNNIPQMGRWLIINAQSHTVWLGSILWVQFILSTQAHHQLISTEEKSRGEWGQGLGMRNHILQPELAIQWFLGDCPEDEGDFGGWGRGGSPLQLWMPPRPQSLVMAARSALGDLLYMGGGLAHISCWIMLNHCCLSVMSHLRWFVIVVAFQFVIVAFHFLNLCSLTEMKHVKNQRPMVQFANSENDPCLDCI